MGRMGGADGAAHGFLYEDVLAAQLDVDVEDPDALREMRAELAQEHGLGWPLRPAWLRHPTGSA